MNENGFVPRLDKKAFVVTKRTNVMEEREYWQSRSPLERLEAVEINRRMVYGHDKASARLQRVLEVVKRPRG